MRCYVEDEHLRLGPIARGQTRPEADGLVARVRETVNCTVVVDRSYEMPEFEPADEEEEEEEEDEDAEGEEGGNVPPGSHRFRVGDRVMVAPDYKRYSDAASGPLRPGQVATVERVSTDEGSAQPYLVRDWWYMAKALMPEGGWVQVGSLVRIRKGAEADDGRGGRGGEAAAFMTKQYSGRGRRDS